MKYFGTDGIRGSYGSENMCDEFALELGKAIGHFLQLKLDRSPVVALAMDTRPSSPALKNAIAIGLRHMSVEVLDFGIAPTPALAFGVIHQKADFGVMVTASHNPHTDNGIKCFSGKGTKLSREEEERLESYIGQNWGVHKPSPDLLKFKILDAYLANLRNFFTELDLGDFRIALDLANGASAVTTPQILNDFGATVFCIHDGDGEINENCGSENLQSLKKLVKETNANIGIAHDGDGDRARFVTAAGEVVSGDQILGLLAMQADRGDSLNSSTFITTVHSNSGLFSSLTTNGISCLHADVGDRNVFLKMDDLSCNWGGESSGHVICTDYLPTGDGLFAALSVMKTMLDQSKSLEDLAHEIKLWPSKTESFLVNSKPPIDQIPLVSRALAKEKDLLHNQGRILLRYSGTEPKLRLLVEGASEQMVEASFANLKVAITNSF